MDAIAHPSAWDRLKVEDPDLMRRLLKEGTEEDLAWFRYQWRFWARPDQILPKGEWATCVLMGGRGSGKTRSGAEAVRRWARKPGRLMVLAGLSRSSVREDMVEGPSGILTISPPDERPKYIPSKRLLAWPNGARATLLSAETPEAGRGKGIEKMWLDEVAAWPRKGGENGDLLDNLNLALREGNNVQSLITTTPRATTRMRAILKEAGTIVVRSTTYDNLHNLAPQFKARILAKYEGTRLGRQELMAEMLEDADGALWTMALIERNARDEAPAMQRVLVGVDPSIKRDGLGDACGIIAGGRGVDGHCYTLADWTANMSPLGWAQRALDLYAEIGASAIVVEDNQGGAMAETIMRQLGFQGRIIEVHASKSKAARAEPIAALWEQGKAHHVGTFPQLEDEMRMMTPAGYVGGASPNRLDAYVWLMSELMQNSDGPTLTTATVNRERHRRR
jgi:phage terminase large subunit-like protein